MSDLGLAEFSLFLVAALVILVVGSGLVAALVGQKVPTAVRRAHRLRALRTSTSTLSGLLVFAFAVALHILNPSWQGVPFVVGPLAASAAGLAVFAVLPSPTIDGYVALRTAGLYQRRVRDYLSSVQRVSVLCLFALVAAFVLAAGLTSKASVEGLSLCAAVFPAACVSGGPTLYPGWTFAAPALLLIAALFAAMLLSLRRIATAPSAAWSHLTDRDAALREDAVRLVVRISVIALVLTLGMFLGAAGIPLMNAPALETGLGVDGDAGARLVGIVLVSVGAATIVAGLVLSFVTIISTAGLPRRTHFTPVASSAL